MTQLAEQKRRLFDELASLPNRPVCDADYSRLLQIMDDAGVPGDLANSVMNEKNFSTSVRGALDRAMKNYSAVLGIQAYGVLDNSLAAGYRVVTGNQTVQPSGTPRGQDGLAWTASKNVFRTPPEFNASAFSPMMSFDASSPS
jgi:hypothetical protein